MYDWLDPMERTVATIEDAIPINQEYIDSLTEMAQGVQDVTYEMTQLSDLADDMEGPFDTLEKSLSKYSAEQIETIGTTRTLTRVFGEQIGVLDEATRATDRSTAAYWRNAQARAASGGFAAAGALAAPPSLYGGLDTIRRGLNVDYQRGAIDFETHQKLLQNATEAFGGNAFAEGGIVRRPMLGLVGEAGPEAIVPLDQFSSGMTVVNYISITVEQAIAGDSLELGETIVREVQDAVDRGDLQLV